MPRSRPPAPGARRPPMADAARTVDATQSTDAASPPASGSGRGVAAFVESELLEARRLRRARRAETVSSARIRDERRRRDLGDRERIAHGALVDEELSERGRGRAGGRREAQPTAGPSASGSFRTSLGAWAGSCPARLDVEQPDQPVVALSGTASSDAMPGERRDEVAVGGDRRDELRLAQPDRAPCHALLDRDAVRDDRVAALADRSRAARARARTARRTRRRGSRGARSRAASTAARADRAARTAARPRWQASAKRAAADAAAIGRRRGLGPHDRSDRLAEAPS